MQEGARAALVEVGDHQRLEVGMIADLHLEALTVVRLIAPSDGVEELGGEALYFTCGTAGVNGGGVDTALLSLGAVEVGIAPRIVEAEGCWVKGGTAADGFAEREDSEDLPRSEVEEVIAVRRVAQDDLSAHTEDVLDLRSREGNGYLASGGASLVEGEGRGLIAYEEVALILPRCCARGVAVDAREGGHLPRLGVEAVEVLLIEGEVSRAVVEGEGVAHPFIAVGLGDA